MRGKQLYKNKIGVGILSLFMCLSALSAAAAPAKATDELWASFPLEKTNRGLLFAAASGDPNWYYDEPEMISFPLFELTGKGVTVGIIDTGIAEHNDIASENITAKRRFCMDDTEETDINDVTDDVGHGTAVAGLICGRGKSANTMRGIATDPNHPELQEMQEAISDAAQSGCIVVAAAGNKGDDTQETDFVSYPAGLENVIGVGSVGSGFVHTSTSQKNESVFVSAPGSRVLVLNYKSPSGYKVDGGTSYAAPIISGMAALIKQMDKNATVDTVKEVLKRTVTDCGKAGYDTSFGYGVANGRALAIYLRNTSFWARKTNESITVSNLGGRRMVYFVQSAYRGARQAYALPESTEISDLSSLKFPLQSEEENYTYKRFFLERESLKPLGGAL